MVYSITQLAKLAGISTRTLRFYDEKNLLRAQRDSESNYRFYDDEAVNKLQKIMFLKLYDLPLNQIKYILEESDEIQYKALCDQRKRIVEEQNRLSNLIINLDKTLATMKGVSKMSNTEKFSDFKTETINKNEELYGKEIRKKYGESIINKSNQQFNSLSEKNITELKKVTQQILAILKDLVGTTNLNQPKAKQLFDLHKQFLLYYWSKKQYSTGAHKAIANLYISDPNFTKYYEDSTGKKGAANTLKAIIDYYA